MRSTFRSTFSPKPSPFSSLPPLTSPPPFRALPYLLPRRPRTNPTSPNQVAKVLDTHPSSKKVIYQSALESGLRPSLAQFIRGL
ncbi:hypothetical protein FA13DRAFT_596068 [Coprinellus micaceus]|uniref:Uncharacterized protein n=1 Tax=Coprinellus micaceus TaxID=71717 RepID=A0A4Y7T6K7_COPMI|nr:hypothetical protein FA13DRAFT_596068 [Coprinellus micaceus]